MKNALFTVHSSTVEANRMGLILLLEKSNRLHLLTEIDRKIQASPAGDDDRIPLNLVTENIKIMAAITQEPNLGLKVVNIGDLERIPLYRTIQHSIDIILTYSEKIPPNIILKLIALYYRVISEVVTLDMEEYQDKIIINVIPNMPDIISHHQIEGVVLAIYRIINKFYKIKASRIQFCHAQPSDDISSNQLVVSSDWEITSIPVRFTNLNASDARPSTDVNLNLRVYTDSTNNFLSGDDGATSALTVSASSAISAGGSRSFTFLFDSSTAIPTGNRAYTIVCHETPSGPSTNYVLFDGDCDPTNSVPTNNDIYTFFVAPRQNSTLDWTIQ